MNVLVVRAHPSPDSFCSALADMVCEEVRAAGHTLRHRDLYEEGFDPVFSAYERSHHVGDLSEKLRQLPELAPHVEDLRWCETLVLVYPTWWSGQPAILKGWFDRVLMNEVAWSLPEGKARLTPMLGNVRRLAVVTTHGSSKLVNMVQGEPGKRTALRSVRLMFNTRTRTRWIGVYGLDKMQDPGRRDNAKAVVRRRIRALLR